MYDQSEAYQTYLDLLNAMRTGLVALKVMSTATWLSPGEIAKLLEKSGYSTTGSRVRHALNRLIKKGVVEKERRVGDRYNRNQWRLTNDGYNMSLTTSAVTSGSQTTTPTQNAGATMCTINKPTLVSAVEKEVMEFISSKLAFSAFDITQSMRKKAADGTLPTIDDKETGTVYLGYADGGKTVPRLDHEDIRTIVHDFFNQGKKQQVPGPAPQRAITHGEL